MNGVRVGHKPGVGRGFGLWLGFAVLLHAAVLLVPVTRQIGEAGLERSLAVSLLRPLPLPAAAPPRVADLPPPDPVEVTAQKRPPPAPPPAPSRPAEEPPRLPGVHELLESARRLEPAAPAAPPRRLGDFVPPAPPRNWQPSIPLEENRFEDAWLPDETEIVDRWLAADGSHNVVIRTPGGMTLCGRALPWDPMRPLVEHVMMFRECAGGGKRTFTMPERLLPRRERQ